MADHDKPIPWETAMEVAQEIEILLERGCQKTRIAGSLRRQKPRVNDVEILVIPRAVNITAPGELFPESVPGDRWIIDTLIEAGILGKRKKTNGTVSYGPRTKLLIHCASKIPVDIFTCNETSWVNCLFSRTGGKDTNIAVASAAKARGMAWEPFSAGFRTRSGEILNVKTEQEIFAVVGLPYLHPTKR